MTNEQLVHKIKSGDREAVNALIEQNTGIIRIIALKYMPLAERNRGAGFEDLQQSAIVGLLSAIPAWDEARGAFLTIAVQYMRTECSALLGIRSTKERIENAQTVAPLSSPAYEDADGITELIETLEDRQAQDPFEAAALLLMQRSVRAEVDKLPERLQRCIKKRWFEGLTFKQANETKDTQRAAFDRLRRNRRLADLYNEYVNAFFWQRGVATFENTQTSSVEAAVIYREQRLTRLSGILQAP